MKKTTKLLVATTMAIIMLFSCFSIWNVSAVVSSNTSPSEELYYFNDYYPTITKSDLQNQYQHFNIVYDHEWLDSERFNRLIDNEYFSSITNNSIVIIDIKTFLPDTDYLEDLFFDLKVNKGCRTMFVSIYDANIFNQDPFWEFVDVYFQSNFERLRSFIINKLRHLTNNYTNSLSNTTIIIDSPLIDVAEYEGADIETLCEASPFLRILLEELAYIFEGIDSTDDYSFIADELNGLYGINFFVYHSNAYVDILTWEEYFISSFSDFQENYNLQLGKICVFGFSHLDIIFYNFLYGAEANSIDFSVYVLEVEPITTSPDGLDIITDGELALLYGEEWDEKTGFLSALQNLIQVSPSS